MSAFISKAAVKNTRLDSVFYGRFRPEADIQLDARNTFQCFESPGVAVNCVSDGLLRPRGSLTRGLSS
jgi:hypothetical protein